METALNPIEQLIDQNVSCMVCGTPRATGCGCFIRLSCPICNDSLVCRADPLQGDPEGTALIEAPCNSCMSNKDPRYSIIYMDRDGNIIDQF